MDIANPRRVTLCMGASSSGKTTFAIRWLLNEPGLACRFIFDPAQEFSKRLRRPCATDVTGIMDGIQSGWCLFDPSKMFKRDEDGLRYFADVAWEYSDGFEGRKVVVLDEVGDFMTPQHLPEELEVLATRGRKRGVELFALSQRPADLNQKFLNQQTEMVVFQLGSPAGVEAVARYGFDPEEIWSLPLLHYVSRSSAGAFLRGKIEFTD